MTNFVPCFVVFVLAKAVMTMKINLQGHLTLGKEVIDTLSYFMDSNPTSGRRNMWSGQENDVVVKMVKSKQLCRDLHFCSGLLNQFIDDYIIIQITAVESIFKASSYEFVLKTAYHDKVKKILRDLRKILKNIDSKINEEKESYYWISIIKKISAKFQKLVTYMVDNLNSFDVEKKDERKLLIQRSIIAIVVIESKYEKKLCAQYGICLKSFECTRALHTILEKLTNIPEDKVRSFLKDFYEALFANTFYSRLSDITAREFQTILNDMAYSKTVPTNSLLQSVQKTVQLRLVQIENYTDTQMGYDVQLIHVILSDLDHFYSTHKSEPFRDFIKNFIDWTIYGQLGKYLRKIMDEIGSEVSSQSEEMSLKLTNEVKVFLELTIDPEK